jgi:hypothetical protein
LFNNLRPAGHPDRSISCTNLAFSLHIRYKHTGDAAVLDEAINLEREVLDLCPAGHPDRSRSCGNLAVSIWTSYKLTGDVRLLDEAIDLKREALGLCPAEHPDRFMSCTNLAASLQTRYRLTGDVRLLDEAIDLKREALGLCPAGHPERSKSCRNLATSLMSRYEHAGDVAHLDQAVDLEREALALQPAGHPDRSLSTGNLASSLRICYRHTRDVGLLNEAIALDREVLALRPRYHPNRYTSCANLADSLNTSFECTANPILLHESLTLSHEGITIAPSHAIWRHSHHLTWAHLQYISPVFDVSKAIMYLSQSLEHHPDDPIEFVVSLSSFLDNLWQWSTEDKHIRLTTTYQGVVSLLPLLVHPALGLQPQLQALKKCTRLGSDAFVNAALAESWSIGLETLELAQGVIWSQTLHRRDPQLKDVPEPLASDLQYCLRAIAGGSANEFHSEDPIIAARTPHDTLHVNSSQVYTLLREIRALPGLDRFMLSETWETLRTAASDHPAVVLVGARGHYYALILAASLANGHVVLPLDLIDEDLKSLSFTLGASRAHRSAATPDGTPEEGDRAGFKKMERVSSKPLDVQLRTLWHKVVKPVLAHLDLKASNLSSSTICPCA